MKLLYRLGWLGFRLMFSVYFRWSVYNPGRVPMNGGVILAGNHASFLDPPLVGAGLTRHVHYMARASLFSNPLAGWLLRHWSAIPVERDGGGAAGLKAILDRLLAGGAILLFPEGTRTRDGNLQKARSGIGLTVVKSDALVIPVRVFGTYVPGDSPWGILKPRRVAVKYGRPLDFKELRTEARACDKPRLKQIYQEIADQIMQAIAGLEPMEDAE